ncbi:MAG: hypothetical protein Q7T68_05775 [Sphingopyxis sp.]|nr:hypothetical protein [Sphingopyxis sp.]
MLLRGRQFRLLRLKDEMTLFVQIDRTGAAARATALYRTFKLISAELSALRNAGFGEGKCLTEVVDELSIIRPFSASRNPLPFGDEALDIHRGLA